MRSSYFSSDFHKWKCSTWLPSKILMRGMIRTPRPRCSSAILTIKRVHMDMILVEIVCIPDKANRKSDAIDGRLDQAFIHEHWVNILDNSNCAIFVYFTHCALIWNRKAILLDSVRLRWHFAWMFSYFGGGIPAFTKSSHRLSISMWGFSSFMYPLKGLLENSENFGRNSVNINGKYGERWIWNCSESFENSLLW